MRASREEWGLERSEDRGIPTTKRPSAQREQARSNYNETAAPYCCVWAS